MNLWELALLAVGLSMDAAAVAACLGLAMPGVTICAALTVGLYFGVFQAGMPLLGFWAGSLFTGVLQRYGHWVAFGVLLFLGGKMVWGSFRQDKDADNVKEAALLPAVMLPLAVATSIDALAVGVSFAALDVRIAPAAAFIGVTTLLLSMVGVKIGHTFGTRFKPKAELIGGLILAAIALKILIANI